MLCLKFAAGHQHRITLKHSQYMSITRGLCCHDQAAKGNHDKLWGQGGHWGRAGEESRAGALAKWESICAEKYKHMSTETPNVQCLWLYTLQEGRWLSVTAVVLFYT